MVGSSATKPAPPPGVTRMWRVWGHPAGLKTGPVKGPTSSPRSQRPSSAARVDTNVLTLSFLGACWLWSSLPRVAWATHEFSFAQGLYNDGEVTPKTRWRIVTSYKSGLIGVMTGRYGSSATVGGAF